MTGSKDYFMSDVALPDEVRLGCVSIRGLSQLPLSAVYLNLDPNKIWATFWSVTPAPWKGASLVHIAMFRLPAAADALLREATEYRETRAKRKVRLPDGPPFEPATLAIPELPSGWSHEPIPRTSRDFVHIYTSPKYAVLVRSHSTSGTILDHPLLRPLNDHLRLHEDAWLDEFPEALPVARTSPIRETPLVPDVAAEISESIARARASLGLESQADPALIIAAISDAVDEFRARKRVSAAEKKQLAIDLGCLWGDALHTAKRWEWCAVYPESDRAVYAVCSPTRAHAVDAIAFIHRVLSKRNANTSALLFSMISVDDLPESTDGSYSWLW